MWPLALLTPYIPGLPRPTPGGVPWRQELLIALLLCATFVLLVRRSLTRNTEPLLIHRSDFPILLPASLLTLWTAASALWAIHPYKALYQALTWGLYLLFFVLMRRVTSRPTILRSSLRTLTVVICVLSLACIINFLAIPADVTSPLVSSFRYFSGFGEMMAIAIPVFAALTLHLRNTRLALLCGATAVLAWVSTIQAMERAPIIGAFSGLLILAIGTIVLPNCRTHGFARAALLTVVLLLAAAIHLTSSPLTPGRASAANRLQSTTIDDANFKVRFLYWGIALEMLRARPLTGIGASNYEDVYPDARSQFSAPRLDNPLVAVHEEMLVRSPHNQYIQVLAELGLIGFVLFSWFCAALCLIFWRALSRSPQPTLALGAGAGMFAFALSSMTSVNSFQWLGGGLMFFFGASIVAHAATAGHISRAPSDYPRNNETTVVRSPIFVRTARACALFATLVMLYNTGTRAMNATTEGAAEVSPDPVRAEQLYRAALWWDATDATTHYNYGTMLYHSKRAKEAVPYLAYAVSRGFNTSASYAFLAAAETESGDVDAAERTYAYAVKVYPRSVFLRARHAAALTEVGKAQEAEAELTAALAINERAARGWQQLITFGADAATHTARTDASIAFPGELQPEECVQLTISEIERRSGIVPAAKHFSAFPRGR